MGEPLKSIEERIREAQLAILWWAMKLCGSGMPPSMLRKQFQNKAMEISNQGDKS